MEPHKYTDEEIADVQAREKAALEYLKENGLQPAAIVSKVKLDNPEGFDIFADRVQAYLQDTRYASIKSPISDEIKKETE